MVPHPRGSGKSVEMEEKEMNATKCDRCGKFYTKNNNKYKENHNNDSVSYVILRTNTNSYGIYDLCDECVNKLMAFLESEKQNDDKL